MEHHIFGSQAHCPFQVFLIPMDQRLPVQAAVYSGGPVQRAIFLLERWPVASPEIHPVVEENQVVAPYQPGRKILRDGFSAPYRLNAITAQGMYFLLQIRPIPIFPQRVGTDWQAHTLNHILVSFTMQAILHAVCTNIDHHW